MSDQYSVPLEREGDSLVLRGQVMICGLVEGELWKKVQQKIQFREFQENRNLGFFIDDGSIPSDRLLKVKNGYLTVQSDGTFLIKGRNGQPVEVVPDVNPDDSLNGVFLVLFEGEFYEGNELKYTDEYSWESCYSLVVQQNNVDNIIKDTMNMVSPEPDPPEETATPPATLPPNDGENAAPSGSDISGPDSGEIKTDETVTNDGEDGKKDDETVTNYTEDGTTETDETATNFYDDGTTPKNVTETDYADDGETRTDETVTNDGEDGKKDNETVTTESTQEGETVDIWTEEGVIRFTNPMTIHAVDAEKGAYREEQVSQLEVHTWRALNDSDSIDPYLASEDRKIDDEKVITINGGVCKKQENGAILIEGSAEDYVSVGIYDHRESHEAHNGVCVEYQGTLDRTWGTDGQSASPMLFGGGMLLAALLGALIALLFSSPRRKKQKKISNIDVIREVPQNTLKKLAFEKSEQKTEMHAAEKAPAQNEPLKLSFGKLQQIGKRSSQQDSFGLFGVNEGLFAVVADGMGGLKDGDRVSQKIVQTIESDCRSMSLDQLSDNLMGIVSHANDEVSRMLGPDEIYKSGSTLVAVVAEPHQFRWISVGDSRIYLYRAGRLLQLNREHIFEADLLMRAVNHQISFQDAKSNPKRKSVSSFIGMGDLKYVDEMLRPIRSLQGDRILICSDGIFNTIKEPRIEAVLSNYPDPKQAAIMLETIVTQANNPHQDNFTAIILSYD